MYLNCTDVLSWVSCKTVAYVVAFWKTFESLKSELYMLCMNIITCLYPPQFCSMSFISVYFLHFYVTCRSIKFGHDNPQKPPLATEYSSDAFGYKSVF
jgi:hypothetical protein